MTTATGALIEQLEHSIARAIRGKDEAIRHALIALLARGHLLIEDVPGVGKTTLAQSLARSFHCAFQRIQFTSRHAAQRRAWASASSIPSSSDSSSSPARSSPTSCWPTKSTAPRPKTQSALLEAMNEAQVTVDNETHTLPQPFMVMATQNPIEHHGTYPLPESQLDRFLLRIRMGYPSRESEKEILQRRTHKRSVETVESGIEAADVLSMQRDVEQVRVEESLLDYALEIVERTRQTERLTLGVSPRGSLMLQRAAQARAFIEGRDFCLPDDFKQLVIPVFAHRVGVNTRYATTQRKSAQAEAILREIVESTRVPL